jgi:hypothetical protein
MLISGQFVATATAWRDSDYVSSRWASEGRDIREPLHLLRYYVPAQPLNISSSHDVRVLGGAVHLDDSFEPSYVRWSGSSCPVYQAVKWTNCSPYIHCTAVVHLHAIRKVIPPHLSYDVTHGSFGHMAQARMKHIVNEGYIDRPGILYDSTFQLYGFTRIIV